MEAGSDPDGALTALYGLHYDSLVKLAALLAGDPCTARRIVQESFVALFTVRPRLASTDRALPFLHQAVVSRCRSARRHGAAVSMPAPQNTAAAMADAPEEAMDGAGRDRIAGAAPPLDLALLDWTVIVAALQTLPSRPREILVLRFYADLSEAQIASAMSISRAAVRRHAAWAMSALVARLAGHAPQQQSARRQIPA